MDSSKDENASAKVSFTSRTRPQLRRIIRTSAPKRTSSLSSSESSLLSSINKSFDQRKLSIKLAPLTVEKVEILQSVDSSSNEYEDDDDIDDGVEPEFNFVPHISYRNVRETLRKSIARHKGSLSKAEVEFLHCVADSDAAESALQRANDVLINDMRSVKKSEEAEEKKQDSIEEEEEEDLTPKESDQRSRPSFVTRAFRMEMYRGLLCALDDNKMPAEEEDEVEASFVKVDNHHVHLAEDEEFNPFLMFTFNRPSLSSLSDMMVEEEKSRRTDRHTVASIPEDDEEETVATMGTINFLILGTSDEPEDIQNSVLSPPLMFALRPFMPYIVQEDNFWLKYSLVRDGASIETFLDKVKHSDRMVLAIETADGEVFGAFTSTRFQAQGERFYGVGEAFLWRMCQPRTTVCDTIEDRVALESDLEVFRWSRQNMNVQMSNFCKIAIGGGVPEDLDSGEKLIEGKDEEDNWTFGLVLNSDMSIGTSGRCATFNSPGLSNISEEGSFKIVNVEAWTMTPVDAVDQAERLEMARYYVMDNVHLNEFP